MLHRKARMAINAILKGATGLDAGLDQYARASFLEGFMNKPVGTFSKRPLAVLSSIANAVKSGAAGKPASSGPASLYLEALQESFDDDAILKFSEPKDSRLYLALVKAISRDNRTKRPTDIVESLLVGMNPVTGETIAKWRGKPLFWHIGSVFRERPDGADRDELLNAIRSFAVQVVVNAKRDVARGEKNYEEVSLTVSDGEGGVRDRDLPDGASEDDLDFSAVLLDPKIADALNRGVLNRIQSRASNAHGNADVKARQDIETAIWIAVQNKSDLMDVQSSQGAYDFSIKQTALADAVNSLTGKQSSPQYLGRVFKETIAFDLKMLLTSGPIRDMIDKKTDIARAYYGDAHRRRAALRASIKRVAGLYASKMGVGIKTKLASGLSGEVNIPGVHILDNAEVIGNAKVFGDAKVYASAMVSGGEVSDNATVSGDAKVYGNAQVYGNAEVYGKAKVGGEAEVYGNAVVSGGAHVYGGARVYGDAKVFGTAVILGGDWDGSEGPITSGRWMAPGVPA